MVYTDFRSPCAECLGVVVAQDSPNPVTIVIQAIHTAGTSILRSYVRAQKIMRNECRAWNEIIVLSYEEWESRVCWTPDKTSFWNLGGARSGGFWTIRSQRIPWISRINSQPLFRRRRWARKSGERDKIRKRKMIRSVEWKKEYI